MSLIPYQRFRIATAAAPADATARLVAAVAPGPLLSWAVTDLPFEGWVRGDEFKISRVTRSGRKGAFVPLIRGRIIATPGGSRLEGRMRLYHPDLAFLAPWSALMVVMASAGFREASIPWAFAALAMLVGLWASGLRAFASEARQARQLLHRVLEGGDPALLLDESRRPTRWAATPHDVHGTPRPVSRLSSSVDKDARIGERTVSSSFTPWWKFGFPLFFIVASAFSSYDFIAHHRWNDGGAWGNAFGELVVLAATVLIVRQHARHRRVKITETGLLVSNFLREIHVPFMNIAGVTYDWSSGQRTPATVTVSFRGPTPLGREAEFFPRGRRDRAIAEGIVAEIGGRAGLAPQTAGAAAG